MLKKMFAVVLLVTCSLAVFGQVKPRIGILPLVGGQAGEGETIGTLLSFQNDILDTFTVVPATNAVNAAVFDIDFQLTGYPDSDSIVRIGRMLNVDFVVSGYIRNLGNRSIVIANVINVNSFEMMGGSYAEYRRREDIPSFLPEMARSIINGAKRDTFSLPSLTIAPFNVARESASIQEVETLAQIFSIDVANSGRYSVLPRMSTVQAAKREYDFQTRGYSTPGDEARALGRSVNARYILNTNVRGTGSSKTITASIYDVENGSLVNEGSMNYRTLSDGVPVMSGLALQLFPGARPPAPAPAAPPPAPIVIQPAPAPAPAPATPPPAPIVIQPTPAPAPIVIQPAPAPAPAPEPEYDYEEYEEEAEAAPRFNFHDPAKLWTIGASVGTAFAPPWLIATIHGTIAPFNYAFLELGGDFGIFTFDDKVDFYYSIYPFAHICFFMPMSKLSLIQKGGFYAGAGAGYMMAYYKFSEGDVWKRMLAADVIVGVNLLNMLDVSYTLRASPWTDLKAMSHKVSVGYVYRF